MGERYAVRRIQMQELANMKECIRLDESVMKSNSKCPSRIDFGGIKGDSRKAKNGLKGS